MNKGVRIVGLLLALALLILSPNLAGYFGEKQTRESEEKIFIIPEKNLQITAHENYEDITARNNFDLQLEWADIYLSVFTFDKTWVNEEITRKDVYHSQNDEILKFRKNIEILEEETTEETKNGAVTRTLYQAKYKGKKNVYDFYLFEFDSTDTFAWVAITASPLNYKVNGEHVINAAYTIEPTK